MSTNHNTGGSCCAYIARSILQGTDRDPIENGVLLVRDGRIQSVSRKSAAAIPEECPVIELPTETILPGLMDLHVHLTMDLAGEFVLESKDSLSAVTLKTLRRAQQTLGMGFTTLRDVGDFGSITADVRDAIANGYASGPRIISSGQLVTYTGSVHDGYSDWMTRTDIVGNVADGVPEVLKAVRRQIKNRADWIKFTASGGGARGGAGIGYLEEEMNALVAEAHARKKPVAAHALYSDGILAAVKAGVQSIEHGMCITEEIADLMREKGTWLVPTQSILEQTVRDGQLMGFSAQLIARLKELVPLAMESVRLAHQKGVRVALGTDAGYYASRHGANARELEKLVQSGMSPRQAIGAATSDAARALQLDRWLGTLEPGKWADFVAVTGDPLEDVALLQDEQRIALVVKEGVIQVDRRPAWH